MTSSTTSTTTTTTTITTGFQTYCDEVCYGADDGTNADVGEDEESVDHAWQSREPYLDGEVGSCRSGPVSGLLSSRTEEA